jgi:hypothetical protein
MLVVLAGWCEIIASSDAENSFDMDMQYSLPTFSTWTFHQLPRKDWDNNPVQKATWTNGGSTSLQTVNVTF